MIRLFRKFFLLAGFLLSVPVGANPCANGGAPFPVQDGSEAAARVMHRIGMGAVQGVPAMMMGQARAAPATVTAMGVAEQG